MIERIMPPVHPGEILRREFLEPMGIAPNAFALRIGVAPARVYDIVNGKRGISMDTALRFAKFFGMTWGYWLNLQSLYDYQVAQDAGIPEKVEDEVRPLRPEEREAGAVAQIFRLRG